MYEARTGSDSTRARVPAPHKPFGVVLLSFFPRPGKTKNRKLSRAGNVDAACVFRARQVEHMTEFATIDFPVGSPGFLDASTFLFEHVGRIKPALQVSAA